jgi:ATP-dependent DNA ligase
VCDRLPGGADWTERYPPIREAMAAPAQDVTIDGEVVVRCGF